MKNIELTQEEFDAQFTLVPAPSDNPEHIDRLYDWYDNPDDMHTAECLTASAEGRLWTEVDAEDDDEGNMVFITLSGYHHVNRLRHYVTVERVPPNTQIIVIDRMERC